jgi:hypothetical protein
LLSYLDKLVRRYCLHVCPLARLNEERKQHDRKH